MSDHALRKSAVRCQLQALSEAVSDSKYTEIINRWQLQEFMNTFPGVVLAFDKNGELVSDADRFYAGHLVLIDPEGFCHKTGLVSVGGDAQSSSVAATLMRELRAFVKRVEALDAGYGDPRFTALKSAPEQLGRFGDSYFSTVLSKMEVLHALDADNALEHAMLNLKPSPARKSSFTEAQEGWLKAFFSECSSVLSSNRFWVICRPDGDCDPWIQPSDVLFKVTVYFQSWVGHAFRPLLLTTAFYAMQHEERSPAEVLSAHIARVADQQLTEIIASIPDELSSIAGALHTAYWQSKQSDAIAEMYKSGLYAMQRQLVTRQR